MDCKAPKCNGIIKAAGLCSKHYQRLKKYGDLNFTSNHRGASQEEKFWPYVNKTSKCWEWTAPPVGGYGRIFISGKAKKAHRVSYELHFGEIPDGLLVLHKCDNPICVRPGHLFLGTHLDNCLDKHKKGRENIESRSGDNHWMKNKPDRIAKGSAYHRSSLTDEQVKSLYCEYFEGGITQRDLAKKYGISHKNISHILLGKTWKHVTESLRNK